VTTEVLGVLTRPEPRKVSTALALATAVTLVVVLPLAIVSWQGRDDRPADSNGLTVVSAGTTSSLGGATLDRDRESMVFVLDDPDVVAVAWSLNFAEGELIANGEHVGPPPHRLDVPEATLGGLSVGLYDLLVSTTDRNGHEDERAARFAIGDPQ